MDGQEPDYFVELMLFLDEMAGNVPYEKRRIKGIAERQAKALWLISKIKEAMDRWNPEHKPKG